MADQEEEDGGKKKKSAMMQMIIGFAVLTIVGGGAGWVIGNMSAQKILSAEKAAAEHKKAEAPPAGEGGEGHAEGEAGANTLEKISTEANGVVQLEPITTNLAYPSENWVRMEVALLFKDKPDVALAEDIHQDILAYLRTVSLQQIEGPRGFEYLKEDIQERVDLRSEGRVSKVLFRTFVLE
jgi:flagellar protein FliL